MGEPNANAGPILRACVLLAGGIKPSPLVAQTGLSVLDLSPRLGATVLSLWLDRFEALATPETRPEVRILHGSRTPAPDHAELRRRGSSYRIVAETDDYRGPAGAVRDACADLPSDTTVLIAEAARYVSGDLRPMLASHVQSGAAITVACNPDQSPAGVYLVLVEALSLVPPIGFMDLKEQWLGKAAQSGLNVRVHRLDGSYSYELRTRGDFLQAARAAGGVTGPTQHGSGGVVQNGNSASLAHPVDVGVTVGPGAVIVDSVVMPGARIGPDAVVARSLVCPGGRVAQGQTVVDAVVPSPTMAGSKGRELQETGG